jgi:hypothetical protein
MKVGRNDKCPCGSGSKLKLCCLGKVDWNNIIKTSTSPIPYLSIRGRNRYFLHKLFSILCSDGKPETSLKSYKDKFTPEAVRSIHEAILEVWPPDSDIVSILESNSHDISGLYIGDYSHQFILRGIVRHLIYSNKIIVIDPFMYPMNIRDEFNPMQNPEQHRQQTLQNVNFWIALSPLIDAGVVEVIRTPADFDISLLLNSFRKQKEKFEKSSELQDARDQSVKLLETRHSKMMAFQHLILGAPDSYLMEIFEELGFGEKGMSARQFIEYVNVHREKDPNFLNTNKPGSGSSQILTFSSGTNYDIAKLTANLTGSYLVTDLPVRWKEIEVDRTQQNAHCQVWSPFAKVLQESPLQHLNNLDIKYALRIRQEGRLQSLRNFLLKVWKHACTSQPFDASNVLLFTEELRGEIDIARNEWKKIDQDLLKMMTPSAVGTALAAGPLIASGYTHFVAAAVIALGSASLLYSRREKKIFDDRFPAALFMKMEHD